MNPNRYNPETKECMDCNCLLPNRKEDIKEHTCNPFTIERKLGEVFGKREPKVEQKFAEGEEVEASLMGKIDAVITTRTGDIMYRITDEEKNLHGYFLQSQVYSLRKES